MCKMVWSFSFYPLLKSLNLKQKWLLKMAPNLKKSPVLELKMANKNRHKIVAVFVALLVSSFSISLSFSPCFSLFPAVSWYHGTPKQPTKWGYRHIYIYICGVEMLAKFRPALFIKILFSLQSQTKFELKCWPDRGPTRNAKLGHNFNSNLASILTQLFDPRFSSFQGCRISLKPLFISCFVRTIRPFPKTGLAK